jgi:hypothetical protein
MAALEVVAIGTAYADLPDSLAARTSVALSSAHSHRHVLAVAERLNFPAFDDPL